MFPKGLTPLKKGKKEYKIIAFDTEDNGEGAPDNFLCACFYGDEGSFYFTSRETARAYIFKKRNYTPLFFAHNLAYDVCNLDYPEGDIHQIRIKSRMIGGTWQYKNRKYKFIDTGNFHVGASIESLGEMLGERKISYNVKNLRGKKINELSKLEKSQLLEYCMKDSEICYKVARSIIDLSNSTNTVFKSFTSASSSMRIFRSNYLDKTYFQRPQFINDCERLAYYGGRTEVFNYNKFDAVKVQDIVSSYPAAMYHKLFPNPNKYTMLELGQWNKVRNTEGVSLCEIEIPKMHIPPLPYIRPDDGRLIFPYGKWTGAYCHNELRMAEKYGASITPIQSIIYHEMIDPFKSYAEHFFKLKNTSTGIQKAYYKLMLNGLSGKFGEKRNDQITGNFYKMKFCKCPTPNYRESICKKCKLRNLDGLEIGHIPADGWINIVGKRLRDPKHSFPIWIAYICAYGRIKLYEEKLSRTNPIYCDTDSCMFIEEDNFNIGKDLGMWEEKLYKNYQAYAPKFYTYDSDEKEEMKLKGIPKKHYIIYKCSECKNKFNIFTLCCNKPTYKVYCFDRPLKLSESLRRRNPDGSHMKPNQWIPIEKVVSIIANKRFKNNDGTSEALEINAIQAVRSFDEYLSKNSV